MGQFSWITQDTNRSILNTEGYQFKVIMTDDKGNKWTEDEYEGYGEFGGKDFFVLVSEMNGMTEGGHEEKRLNGIDLNLSDRPHLSPSLSECGKYFGGQRPMDCPNQGWLTDDDEEEDEW